MDIEIKNRIDNEIKELSQREIITVSTIYEYPRNNPKQYRITIKKPKGLVITRYIMDYMFHNELNRNMKNFGHLNGNPTYYERKKINLINIENIELLDKEKNKMFKRFNV